MKTFIRSSDVRGHCDVKHLKFFTNILLLSDRWMFCFLSVIASLKKSWLISGTWQSCFRPHAWLPCTTWQSGHQMFVLPLHSFFTWKESWKLFKLPFSFLASGNRYIYLEVLQSLCDSRTSAFHVQSCVNVYNKWWVFFGEKAKHSVRFEHPNQSFLVLFCELYFQHFHVVKTTCQRWLTEDDWLINQEKVFVWDGERVTSVDSDVIVAHHRSIYCNVSCTIRVCLQSDWSCLCFRLSESACYFISQWSHVVLRSKVHSSQEV